MHVAIQNSQKHPKISTIKMTILWSFLSIKAAFALDAQSQRLRKLGLLFFQGMRIFFPV
jgi:hypothetical protein